MDYNFSTYIKQIIKLFIIFSFYGCNIMLFNPFGTETYNQNVPLFIPTTNLTGYFRIDGNVSDSTSNANDGAFFGNCIVSQDRFGNNNGALSLDGAMGTYLQIPYLSDYDQEGSISLWWKTPGDWDSGSGTTAASLIHRSNSSNGAGGIHLYQYPAAGLNYFTLQIKDASNNVAFSRNSSVGWTDNNWHNIIIIFRKQASAAIDVYIDGAQETNISGTCSLAWDFNPNLPYSLGAVPVNPWWGEWKGSMDDFRIYNRVLTPSEISAIANEK